MIPTQDNVTQPISQEKVDTNVPQQNIDPSLAQNGQIPTKNTEESGQTTNQEDPNWKAFREARKRDREERLAAERKAAEKEAEVAALKAAMETAFSKQAPSQEAYQQYYGMNQYEQPDESEDQRIEKKVNKLLADREEKYRKEQEARERQEYPNKLISNYPDFNNVCSQENLDYLDYHYPELSRPLQRLPEGYDKWSDIYHAVKKLIPNHGNMKKEATRADQNSNKPKSMSGPQLSPPGEKVAEPWQEVERRRAENWARMQKTINRMG